jgi:putative oxidoreductase
MQRLQKINQTQLKAQGEYDFTDAIQFEKLNIGKFLIRLSIGGLMLFHGLFKLLHGTDQIQQILSEVGLPTFFSFGVLIGEVLAPVMLIIGYKVRLGAFLIAFDMFMSILLVHARDILSINNMGGWMIEINALYLLGAVSIMFLGSGRFAVTRGHGLLD